MPLIYAQISADVLSLRHLRCISSALSAGKFFVPADAADFIRRFSLMFYFCAICGKDFCRMQLLLKLRALRCSWKSNHIANIVHTGYKLYHSFKT